MFVQRVAFLLFCGALALPQDYPGADASASSTGLVGDATVPTATQDTAAILYSTAAPQTDAAQPTSIVAGNPNLPPYSTAAPQTDIPSTPTAGSQTIAPIATPDSTQGTTQTINTTTAIGTTTLNQVTTTAPSAVYTNNNYNGHYGSNGYNSGYDNGYNDDEEEIEIHIKIKDILSGNYGNYGSQGHGSNRNSNYRNSNSRSSYGSQPACKDSHC
ncbi:hypothetical protein HDV03_004101 [Kappamyces sp. JEL0829]|nr:hypothetical protein HDV03_004101 [Kappamyces sp. JEL0829]